MRASLRHALMITVRYRYSAEPHPHLRVDEIVEPALYREMRFPDDHVAQGASWGLTAGDQQYAEVLLDPQWKALHDTLRGEDFVSSVLRAFAGDMRARGCLVDPDRARLTSFVESRAEKEQATLASEGDPNDIFTRLDFQSKASGCLHVRYQPARLTHE